METYITRLTCVQVAQFTNNSGYCERGIRKMRRGTEIRYAWTMFGEMETVGLV
jgi:hypothetical protein